MMLRWRKSYRCAAALLLVALRPGLASALELRFLDALRARVTGPQHRATQRLDRKLRRRIKQNPEGLEHVYPAVPIHEESLWPDRSLAIIWLLDSSVHGGDRNASDIQRVIQHRRHLVQIGLGSLLDQHQDRNNPVAEAAVLTDVKMITAARAVESFVAYFSELLEAVSEVNEGQGLLVRLKQSWRGLRNPAEQRLIQATDRLQRVYELAETAPVVHDKLMELLEHAPRVLLDYLNKIELEVPSTPGSDAVGTETQMNMAAFREQLRKTTDAQIKARKNAAKLRDAKLIQQQADTQRLPAVDTARRIRAAEEAATEAFQLPDSLKPPQ